MFVRGIIRNSTVGVEKGADQIISEVKGYGHNVKQILFDNEIVFNSMKDYLRDSGQGYRTFIYPIRSS